MSIIAEFSVKSDDLALNHALTAAPQMIVEIEQVVATMEDRIMPYFWVSGGDQDEFEDAFEEDETVTNTAVIDEVEGARLYRAEWTDNVETIIYAYVELGATLMQAIGKENDWELRMRFDSHDSLSEFQDYCDRNGISIELHRTQEQEQPMASAQYDLTPTQRETLVTALEAGYYDVPRAVTMRELAEQMGVAQQTLSNRFRAAYKNLVTSTLTISHPDEDEE
ncbi:helix-turn-helix domain-containing protein [Haloterrigena sp. SYSU A558-1]|uniref:Helix-turn-helix domain-containing protein n=1 Tax=Haloterrigena gelatinilytica TaxID=2741724 RepID=A0A8J8GPL4_9EURY|nr:bacterio-opsin activator domain-containing protein [Haloterrigena gelatinilytica]NUB91652.1 helix-turn-helix domain-containing protein [Haloterrigena gelatinilytica]NUC72523.1 helix-turn-helix domain-containing protein [Haloterrigena gelatinilytica]